MVTIAVDRWLRSARYRRLVLLLALVGGLAFAALRGFDAYLGGFGSIGSLDFIEYWSAGRLAMDGGNPYDPVSMLAVQRAVEWPYGSPNLMWNPPWTLALAMPLALLPFRVATFIWLLLGVILVLASGFFLWRYFVPQSRRYWIGLLLAACFLPGWSVLYLGQVSLWVLAGIVGFLWASRTERDLVAGAALAPLMIKPHLTYLFSLAVLWWVWREQRWGVLIGWLVGLLGASGIVLAVDRNVFGEYLATATSPPLYWATPTLGTWLRVLFGIERRWLQFIPSLLGIAGLVVCAWRRRSPWRWELLAPRLLLASVVTSSYGWSHDQVVLLPVVVALVAELRAHHRLRRIGVLLLVVVAQLGLAAMSRWHVPDAFAIWHAPVLGGLYWWVTGRPARRAQSRAETTAACDAC